MYVNRRMFSPCRTAVRLSNTAAVDWSWKASVRLPELGTIYRLTPSRRSLTSCMPRRTRMIFNFKCSIPCSILLIPTSQSWRLILSSWCSVRNIFWNYPRQQWSALEYAVKSLVYRIHFTYAQLRSENMKRGVEFLTSRRGEDGLLVPHIIYTFEEPRRMSLKVRIADHLPSNLLPALASRKYHMELLTDHFYPPWIRHRTRIHKLESSDTTGMAIVPVIWSQHPTHR